MNEQEQSQQTKNTLESFLTKFVDYSKEVFSEHRRCLLDKQRAELQRLEPRITQILIEVLGGASFSMGGGYLPRQTLSRNDLLRTALIGGNNELPHNFIDFNPLVQLDLNNAIGAIDTGVWPPKEKPPVLMIKDAELKNRCADLLARPGNYDTVIREATTVLEDRMRRKAGHDLLARLIPNAVDQTGENLVNNLFSPDNPILVTSSEKLKRIALHRILLGIVSYLRNPYHHKLDSGVAWSWAWSVVGLIDRLLSDIDSCTVSDSTPPGRGAQR